MSVPIHVFLWVWVNVDRAVCTWLFVICWVILNDLDKVARKSINSDETTVRRMEVSVCYCSWTYPTCPLTHLLSTDPSYPPLVSWQILSNWFPDWWDILQMNSGRGDTRLKTFLSAVALILRTHSTEVVMKSYKCSHKTNPEDRIKMTATLYLL